MNKEASGDTGEEFRGKLIVHKYLFSYFNHVFITHIDCDFYTR